MKYYYLKEGDIIEKNDKVNIPFYNVPKWQKTYIPGEKAPNPTIRKYRRKIEKKT